MWLKLVSRLKCVTGDWQEGSLTFRAALHHCSEAFHVESLPLGWYEEKFPKLVKLSNVLKNVDLVDGKLVDVNDNSIVHDERLIRKMYNFKALSRAFLGNPSVQEEVMKNVNAAMAGRKGTPPVCFTKPIERDPITIDSLTKVSNFLNISSQQKKVVRFTICPQVTQHRIWTGTLEDLLSKLKADIELLDPRNPSKGTFMGQQIVSTCLKFLAETACCQDEYASSWMRPKTYKLGDCASSRTWEEVLDMFNDLISFLKDEESLVPHVSKLDAMKEGLAQIKDLIVDGDIGYKEVQHGQSLTQKKLVKTLGHSSRCLFTLLRYYLHQTVCDMEVEVSGGLSETGEKDKLCLYMGKVLTSDEEKAIWSGMKQLDRALGLFKFVWDTAKVERKLELQGHLWCVGTQSRAITHRGNLYLLHGINP